MPNNMTDLEIVDSLLEDLGQDEMGEHPEDSSTKIITIDAFNHFYIETSGYMLDRWSLTYYNDPVKVGDDVDSLLSEIRNNF